MHNKMTKKEILQNLYQIQELMQCDIFYLDIDEDDDINDAVNDTMFTALNKAIEIIENKGA